MPCRVRRVGADGRMTKGAAGRGGAGGGQSLVKSRMAKAGGGVKAKAAGGLVQAGGGGALANRGIAAPRGTPLRGRGLST